MSIRRRSSVPGCPVIRRQRMRLSAGTDLSFVTAGDPSRPAILLLHGFPSSWPTGSRRP
jgi:pimeloyl-ACP methyl ester carboxylesterase